MIHDFAKSPRHFDLKPQLETSRAEVQVRLPKGRWFLLAFAFVLLGIWRFSGSHTTPAPDFVPGKSESTEYQEALDQQEREIEEDKHLKEEAAAKEAHARQVLNFQEKLKNSVTQEPEYGFYDSLSGSAWSVPVQTGIYVTEEDRKRANQRYMLQAASVKDATDAQRIVQKLRQLGLQAFYTQDESGGWYRVNVGPFNNVSKMNKAEDILVSLRMMPLKKKI